MKKAHRGVVWMMLVVSTFSTVLAIGCASHSSSEHARSAADPALSALRSGSFEQAAKIADADSSGSTSSNPYARLVRAIVRYKRLMQQLSLDVRTVVIGGLAAGGGGFNHKYLLSALEQGESELGNVESDLAVAASDPNLALELCVACWDIDWNGNGRIDGRDRELFQIEHDESGAPLPDDDPRRKPTFRFDAGDVAWARALVSFQRALMDIVLAYDWSDVDRLTAGGHGGRADRSSKPPIIVAVIHLIHPKRIAQAKERILEGIDQSDASRRAYLAETDDDREWVPNPRQRSHPIPLSVDQALYDTWEGVLGDLRRLVKGEEGLLVADLIALGDSSRDDVARAGAGADRHRTQKAAPKGALINIGAMLEHPRDITITAHDIEALDRVGSRGSDVEAALSAIFGDRYLSTSMKPSPLPRRLLRMKGEIDRREDDFERKLRYLFWLN